MLAAEWYSCLGTIRIAERTDPDLEKRVAEADARDLATFGKVVDDTAIHRRLVSASALYRPKDIGERAVVMPTDSSSLKAYARFAGFSWRDDDPGGTQSLAWWCEYWKDAERNARSRDRVLRYNEDDVRASFVVRDWVTAFSRRHHGLQGEHPESSPHPPILVD